MNGAHAIFYNQAADTNGSVALTSIKSVGRYTAGATRSVMPAGIVRRGVSSLRSRANVNPNRVFVTYKDTASVGRRTAAANVEAYEHASGVDIHDAGTQGLTRALVVPAGVSVASFTKRLQAHGEVASVSPVHYRYVFSTTPVYPNNTHFAADQQWYEFATSMPNAWAYTMGAGIKIAVIDTGVDATNPNIANKITFSESVVGGVTTLGNTAVQDTDGHGSNVASIAGSVTNNGVGWAAYGWNANLIPIRIFPPTTAANENTNQADTADEAQAIYDAVANGADVVNLSLGGTADSGVDPVELAAVEYAIGQGVAVVAADGNEGPGNISDFPAGYPGVIAVGASALNDNNTGIVSSANVETIASYSNDDPTIVAPGGDPNPGTDTDYLHWIYNVATTTGGAPDLKCTGDCGFLFAGTSQATPQVSGAVALALAAKGGPRTLTPAQVSTLLQSTADSIVTNPIRQGAGRLDVYRLLADIKGDTTGTTYVPSPQQLRVFAYSNSGGTVPTILDVNAPKGSPVSSAGTFEIADVPTSVSSYKIGIWYNAAGNGVVSPGDLFGASAACTSSAPCSASNITLARVVAGFTLP
jgi:subtilisin family serine protease